MESDSDAILYSTNKLRVRCRRHRGETAPTSFSVHRQQAPEPQLQSATIAPGSDGVRELDRLGAAFESEPDKRVGHETLPEAGVYRSEHEIGVGRPDRIRRALAQYCRLCAECRHADRAATPDREVGSSYAE